MLKPSLRLDLIDPQSTLSFCSGHPINLRPPPCWPTLRTSLPRSEQRRTRTRRPNLTSWSLPPINYFHFFKPPRDFLKLKYWLWYEKLSENQIQCLSVLLKLYSVPSHLIVSGKRPSSWRPGNSHSDPPQHYTRTVSVLYITPHTSPPKAAPGRQITLETRDLWPSLGPG